jgi:hypothetical protein
LVGGETSSAGLLGAAYMRIRTLVAVNRIRLALGLLVSVKLA